MRPIVRLMPMLVSKRHVAQVLRCESQAFAPFSLTEGLKLSFRSLFKELSVVLERSFKEPS